MGEPQKPSGTTQEVEALKRRIHQEVGEWIARHWRDLAWAAGGALSGAAAVYVLFAAQVHGASRAADDAMKASTELKSSVSELKGEIKSLVTQQQISADEQRIQELEDWKCYAQQYRAKRSPDDCDKKGK